MQKVDVCVGEDLDATTARAAGVGRHVGRHVLGVRGRRGRREMYLRC
jgi:hypothetical protein